MNLSSPKLKKIVLALLASILFLLLFLWLALPRIVQSQAEKFVAEKTGHTLAMERPQFNPFALALRLTKLQLTDPQGKPLLAFDELLVDVSVASLPLRAMVFDAIRLDGIEVTLVELPGGALNWSPFLDALKSKEEKPAVPGLPRLDIRRFDLANGRIEFADRRSSSAAGYATRIEPLELSLTDLSTLPDDSGKFRVAAQTSQGARLELAGEIDLNPMLVSGTVNLTGLKLDQLAPYVKDTMPAPPAGVVSVSAGYRVGNAGQALNVELDQIDVKVADLRVPLGADPAAAVAIGTVSLQQGNFDLATMKAGIGTIEIRQTYLELPRIGRSLELALIKLEDARIDLAGHQATLARVSLAEGKINAVRGSGGQLYLVDALAALSGPAKPAGKPAAADAAAVGKPWQFKLDALKLADFSVAMRDERVMPAVQIGLDKIALEVNDISNNLQAALPVKLAFDIVSGGRFEAAGKYTPAGPEADIQLKLVDLALKPAEPYLQQKLLIDIAGGRLSSQGRVKLDAKAGPSYRGDLALRDLKLNEAGTSNTLLGWKQFGTGELTATSQRLDISELRLNGLDTKLMIDKDKNVNLKRVLKPAPAGSEPTPAPVAEPAAVPPAPTFVVNVDRLRFYNGEMYFADESLVLPFGTRIHRLRGTVNHLSSQPGGEQKRLGQLELEGDVDEYGLARAVGQVDFFDPTGFMDIRVLFKNVEMTRLTPYVAHFAGRRIDSGKLSLDLQYKIKQRQLQGENQVVIDRLNLGERVESATAKDLPLDLAIAILQDSDGRIDLGLPISGDLDDPQFSYGSIVWKAITNVLTKIVTAPFRALASLFGGNEKIESIAFEAGAGQLTPPEREKLVRLAEGMAKRPGLMLGVGGIFAETDRVAIQDVQLRRTLMTRMGQKVSENWDPGSISTSQPAVRDQLEKLFSERIGASDLAALKEGFRKANPGQLEEGVTGKMMSRLSGLLREKKTLGDDEVAQLKGADFYALLYERVRAAEVVGDDRLRALGQARGEFALATLKSAGLAPERIQALPPEKGESAEGNVALKHSSWPSKPASKGEPRHGQYSHPCL
jgi:uncharacterized protein involved in outer membrane biogenesis